jgi:hypothetical protein
MRRMKLGFQYPSILHSSVPPLSPPEVLIKDLFRFFTKSSGSLSKVNILEEAIPQLREGEER